MSMNVSICILNWQASSLTIRCLQHLLQLNEITEDSDKIDIVIVDNHSQDNSAKHISDFIAQSKYKRFHFIQSNENQGYAAGNNQAIAYALEQLSPQYIWILNNDTLPSRDSLTALLEAATEDPSVAIWGSSLLDVNGRYLECAGGSYYHPCLSTYSNALKGVLVDAISNELSIKPLDYIEGAAMFVDAIIFREYGLFNEKYFLYFEELDLIKHLPPNRRIEWCKKSLVRHVGGASVENKMAEYQSNLSALIYTRKYHPFCFPFMAMFRFTAKLIRNTFTGKWSLNKTLLSSYKHYFLGRTTSR